MSAKGLARILLERQITARNAMRPERFSDLVHVILRENNYPATASQQEATELVTSLMGRRVVVLQMLICNFLFMTPFRIMKYFISVLISYPSYKIINIFFFIILYFYNVLHKANNSNLQGGNTGRWGKKTTNGCRRRKYQIEGTETYQGQSEIQDAHRPSRR